MEVTERPIHIFQPLIAFESVDHCSFGLFIPKVGILNAMEWERFGALDVRNESRRNVSMIISRKVSGRHVDVTHVPWWGV